MGADPCSWPTRATRPSRRNPAGPIPPAVCRLPTRGWSSTSSSTTAPRPYSDQSSPEPVTTRGEDIRMRDGRCLAALLGVLLWGTIALGIPLAIQLASTTVRAEESGSQSAPVGLAVMQISGRAFQEGLQAGDRDQARLFLWSLEGPDQSILGPDVSLFEPGCVAKFGAGVQCAYFPVVVNAIFAEIFDTSTPDLVGHNAIRLASSETWRIFFDPAPWNQELRKPRIVREGQAGRGLRRERVHYLGRRDKLRAGQEQPQPDFEHALHPQRNND